MAGNSKEKETRPPSSLRHEITIDSTDDESMLDQYSVNESNADDDGPVDDVIARFGVSQKKIRTKNELPTATFLSRPDLAAGNRSPSPSPGYQPFRQVPTTGNPKSGTNITKASKHLRFNPAGLLTPPTSHIGTAVSTTQAEVNFVNARGQGQVADAGIALHVESPSSGECESPCD